MRIFRRLNSLFAILLKIEHFGTTASNTSLPAVWQLWNPSYLVLNRQLGHLSIAQRKHFFSMPEMLNEKFDHDLNVPHPGVRGMSVLNKDAFKRIVVIPALKVDKGIVSKLLKSLKEVLLKRPGLKRVVEDPEDDSSVFVLLDATKIPADCSLGESVQQTLKNFGVNPEIIKYKLELTYDHFKADEVLQAVLPEGQEVTTGFSRVGHIAHLNLRDHQLPYKHLIGQVIIDKNHGITCAVNKITGIDNAYRNFHMEVLAGDETSMITKVKENYLWYEFDFSKVYWNPRLETEHTRIVSLLKQNDVLFDVFAGVGPFAIPAAKKKCIVFANDLNPESYKWLRHNCKLNKVDEKVQVFNMDGRDFLKGPVKEELVRQLSLKERESALHIVMNLPAMAIEFLDVFRHLLDGEPARTDLLPTVHCYCFSKHDDPAKDTRERVEACLGTSLEGLCSVMLVRNVAPHKEMMRFSFRLPASVLYKPLSCPAGADSPQEPTSKRMRLNEDSQEETNQKA
ncbi:tRNA (guanine(37)-N(1))-methyltransferase isoform X1 [Pogona vitticeps]